MKKAIQILAIGFIMIGLALAVHHIRALNAHALLNRQLQTMRDGLPQLQAMTDGGAEEGQRFHLPFFQAPPNAGQSLQEAGQLPEDPFSGLRQPSWDIIPSRLLPFFDQNHDFAGWIKIADTNIDYPIVKANDNEYYLNHDFNQQASRTGAIFMDYRNVGNFEDVHTIIYGHRMKDRTMFYDLMKYKNPSFYEQHRSLSIETLYGWKEYRVFAAYNTSTDFYFIETRFEQQSHQAFIDAIRKKSLFDWDTEISEEDRILTLATCSQDFINARFVVHAKLINPAE